MPNYINARSVQVRSNIFKDNTSIVNVDCNNVPWVGNNMQNGFRNCTSLQKVTNIPNGITNMSYTFCSCNHLTNVPSIPDSVTNMQATFNYCTNLQTLSINLPSNITALPSTFAACVNLITIPTIPDSVTNLSKTFQSCVRLNTAPALPANVTDLSNTFEIIGIFAPIGNQAFGLHEPPIIPNKVTNMTSTFNGQTCLRNTPVIPSSVTTMVATFRGCKNITTMNGIIPANVASLQNTFNGCINLSGNIYINSNKITSVTDCFANTSLTKNVYIPFMYENSEYTKTYNTFTSAGYDNAGTKEGVYLKDISEVYGSGGTPDPTVPDPHVPIK